jgi:glycosyltransferase involved in cell wall biosynthesis
MNVAFDISALGIGHRHESGRTGIFRVVDRLAQGLISSTECDVTFVAGASFETLRDCLGYFRSMPVYDQALLAQPRFLALQVRLEHVLRSLRNDRGDHEGRIAPGRVRAFANWLAGEAVGNLRGLLGGGAGSLDRRAVSSADVYHSPEFPLQPCGGSVQRVLTCYDLIPIKHPEFVLPSHRRFAAEIVASVRPSDWVICISETVRNDLCEYLHFDPRRTFVTYLAADRTLFHHQSDEDSIARVRAKYGIPDGPYLLSLATLEPRRNIRHLIGSFVALLKQEHLPDLSLILAGHSGWGLADLFDAVGRDESIRRRIILTGYARDEDLAPLYSGALAFVYPSLCDGFGLTPLEAMQCATPVITSNTSSLPEVVGDAAILVDPSDVVGLCNGILSIYKNESLRQCMRAKSLARAKQFSWKRCIEETIAAYHICVEGRD